MGFVSAGGGATTAGGWVATGAGAGVGVGVVAGGASSIGSSGLGHPSDFGKALHHGLKSLSKNSLIVRFSNEWSNPSSNPSWLSILRLVSVP